VPRWPGSTRVKQEAVVGFDQVQAKAARLEADQEHRVGAVLEAPHLPGPVLRLAVQVAVPDAGRVEPVADVREEAGELAETSARWPPAITSWSCASSMSILLHGMSCSSLSTSAARRL
jgi:hypothetical protein